MACLVSQGGEAAPLISLSGITLEVCVGSRELASLSSYHRLECAGMKGDGVDCFCSTPSALTFN